MFVTGWVDGGCDGSFSEGGEAASYDCLMYAAILQSTFAQPSSALSIA